MTTARGIRSIWIAAARCAETLEQVRLRIKSVDGEEVFAADLRLFGGGGTDEECWARVLSLCAEYPAWVILAVSPGRPLPNTPAKALRMTLGPSAGELQLYYGDLGAEIADRTYEVTVKPAGIFKGQITEERWTGTVEGRLVRVRRATNWSLVQGAATPLVGEEELY